MRDQNYYKKLIAAKGQYGKEKEYWLNKLSGGILKSHFPYDYKKQSGKTKPKSMRFIIAEDIYYMLLKIISGSDVRLHMILVAAAATLVEKYTSSTDILLGTVIYKQDMEGDFINTILVLRNKLKTNMTFKELILKVRETIREAVENANFPIELLTDHLELNLPGSESDNGFPLFDIAVLLENIQEKKYLKRLNNNLTYSFKRNEKNLMLEVEYNDLLYREETIKRQVVHLENLLRKTLLNVDKRISHVDIISEKEKEQILYNFNNSEVKYPKDKIFNELFEEQVEKCMDKIALQHEDNKISFKEMNARANQLARILVDKGIQKDSTVGIMMNRSPLMAVSILAIWKVGSAYIPINPLDPEQRIVGILRDSNSNVLLIDSRYRDLKFELDYKIEIISLHQIQDSFLNKDRSNLFFKICTDCLAYVIYTSGSTGKPKGVMIEQKGMINHIQAKINDLHITEKSIVAQNASHTFDISIWQFFAALASGGTTVIYSNQVIGEPTRFMSLLKADRVTILEVVPSYLTVMLDALELQFQPLNSLSYLLVTGETVKPALVKRWFEKYPAVQLVNAYGPTEASDDITHCFINQKTGTESIPIGRPLQNLSVYIVDQNRYMCPVGVKGEIWVSGIGVGRGYMNDLDKTAQAFTVDPFVDVAGNGRGKRLYKTGDLGRWLADGTIEFFGRKDQQIKIRGYRIELEEIENRLSAHPDIKEAIVISGNWDQDKQIGESDTWGGSIEHDNIDLCAYITSDKKLDVSGLKESLARELPDYMVPTYFVQLEEIPLTPTGKIDRKDLPSPWIEMKEEEYIAPVNDMEKRLVSIWAEVLNLDASTVGINTDFFSLGGQSLKAIQLATIIHKQFQVNIPLIEFFKVPTIKGICGYLQKAAGEKYITIKPVEAKEYYLLSSAQKRIYFLYQMDKGNLGYNMPNIILLDQPTDAKKLAAAFKKLISRHESLRTSFELVKDEPVQRVHRNPHFEIEYNDEEGVERMIRRFIRPFDLSRAPLLRVGLMKTRAGRYILVADLHHIISDGISAGLLEKEFVNLYEEGQLPPLKIHYKDFSEWQNHSLESGKLKKQEEYWLSRFETEIPVLRWPRVFHDNPGADTSSTEGSLHTFETGKELTEKVKELIKERGTTLFVVLLAVYNILLSKYTDQEDIIVGTGVSGRRHADLHDVIGMFVNMLPIRNQPAKEKKFKEFLEEVKEEAINAFENQDYQFEELVRKLNIERKPGRNPIFNTALTVEGWTASQQRRRPLNDRSKYASFGIEQWASNFDLIIDAAETDHAIIFSLQYVTWLFDKITIEKIARWFEEIFQQIVENNAIQLKDIAITYALKSIDADVLKKDSDDFAF